MYCCWMVLSPAREDHRPEKSRLASDQAHTVNSERDDPVADSGQIRSDKTEETARGGLRGLG